MNVIEFKEKCKLQTDKEREKIKLERQQDEYEDTELISKWKELREEQKTYGEGFKPKFPNKVHTCPNCSMPLNISISQRKWDTPEYLFERAILSCPKCGYEFAGEKIIEKKLKSPAE